MIVYNPSRLLFFMSIFHHHLFLLIKAMFYSTPSLIIPAKKIQKQCRTVALGYTVILSRDESRAVINKGKKLFTPCYGNLATLAINYLSLIDSDLVFRQDLVPFTTTLNYIALFFLVHRLCPKGSFFCPNGYISMYEWVLFLSERVHGISKKS